jgi:hypothetical protein
MLLALQTIFNTCELIIITDSLLPQPIYNFFVSSLYRLCLIILYHDFVQPIFKLSYRSHHRVFLDIAKLIFFDILQFIFKYEKELFFLLSLMLFFIE